jgi:glycosyltransferase involved in cell wall biosynthesis
MVSAATSTERHSAQTMLRPIRVLHVGKYLPPHPGGMERFLDDLMRAQTQSGLASAALVHASRIAAPSSRPADPLQAPVYQARVLAEALFVPLSAEFPLRLSQAIRRFQPDLLHLHLPNLSAFHALLLPSARRLPWVIQWQADVPHDMPRWLLRRLRGAYALPEQAVLRRARRIVVSSVDYLESSTSLQPHLPRCRVLPLGMPDLPGMPLPEPPAADALRILAIGRLTYYKGFEHLLRALVQVPQARLQLIGSGEGEAELRRLVDALGLADRVSLSGQVDDARLIRALGDCDVFCLPSLDRAESFGLVLLEAMRAGRAVVASRIPGSGVNAVVADGISALQVPPGDADALAAALNTLALQPELRLRLGQAGRVRFDALFRIGQCATALRAIYEEALAEAATRASAD